MQSRVSSPFSMLPLRPVRPVRSFVSISPACSPSHALQAEYLQLRWDKDRLCRVLRVWSCLAATNSIARASFVAQLQRVRLQQLLRSWHMAALDCRRCRAAAWAQWQEYVHWRQAVPEMLMTAYRAYYLRSACTICLPWRAMLLKDPVRVCLPGAGYSGATTACWANE